MRNKLRTWAYGAAGLVMAGGLLFTPIQGILPAAGDAPSAYVNAETLMGWHTFSDGKTYYYVAVTDCNTLLAACTGLSLFLFFRNLRMKPNRFINAVAVTTSASIGQPHSG